MRALSVKSESPKLALFIDVVVIAGGFGQATGPIRLQAYQPLTIRTSSYFSNSTVRRLAFPLRDLSGPDRLMMPVSLHLPNRHGPSPIVRNVLKLSTYSFTFIRDRFTLHFLWYLATPIKGLFRMLQCQTVCLSPPHIQLAPSYNIVLKKLKKTLVLNIPRLLLNPSP